MWLKMEIGPAGNAQIGESGRRESDDLLPLAQNASAQTVRGMPTSEAG